MSFSSGSISSDPITFNETFRDHVAQVMNFIQDCRVSETSSDLEDVRNQFMYFVIGKSIGKIQNRLLKRPFFANKFTKIL